MREAPGAAGMVWGGWAGPKRGPTEVEGGEKWG